MQASQPELTPPAVMVPGAQDAPTPVIREEELRMVGQKLSQLFTQYSSDRRIAELKWLRNLRQYLGQYDPEIEKDLAPNRSRAYPRITRVKVISTLSRIMNLMFPGNERNWELKASPNADMSPMDVMKAVEQLMARYAADGQRAAVTDELVRDAVQRLANERAEMLATLIDDQLQELGGDQTLDYVALSRRVAQSGIMYGLGLLRGPMARPVQSTSWQIANGMPTPVTVTQYKPMFEFVPVWDFYPDMSAKTLYSSDGYFLRLVMSRGQVRKLADRSDFFGDQIKTYLSRNNMGNYKAQPFETELRAMGTKVNVNEQKPESSKYEILCWHGSISGHDLARCGVEVPDDKLADDVDAEIWMIDGNIIKAMINPWKMLGVDVRTIHFFQFDEDDTSPIGNGLPNVIRDSQMSVAASTRMMLDNASVVCGPNLELNTDLLRMDQDLTSVAAYKMWYREGTGPEAQYPAVRPVAIDGHLPELQQMIEMFTKFADAETFVGPLTGGDMSKAPREPMRTIAGASMMQGDAALPFKDIVRNFDLFTQSLIASLVQFNRKFNPDRAPEGDYDVIARGATSLIAKEVRGMQVDMLAQTLTPEERMHVDERKLVEARLKVRDLGDMLVPPDEAKRREAAAAAARQQMEQTTQEMMQAEIRKTLADAFKAITQGQKNSAASDAQSVQAALQVLQLGMNEGSDGSKAGADTKSSQSAKDGKNARAA